MIANFAPGLWTPGTPRIPVTLSDIIAKVTAANKTKRKGLVIAG